MTERARELTCEEVVRELRNVKPRYFTPDGGERSDGIDMRVLRQAAKTLSDQAQEIGRLRESNNHRDGLIRELTQTAGKHFERATLLEGALRRAADDLLSSEGEPWPGPDGGRLHYWRDKAITVADQLRTQIDQAKR